MSNYESASIIARVEGVKIEILILLITTIYRLCQNNNNCAKDGATVRRCDCDDGAGELLLWTVMVLDYYYGPSHGHHIQQLHQQ